MFNTSSPPPPCFFSGHTPLSFAARIGHLELVRLFLLDYGAKIHKGESLLYFESAHLPDRLEICRLLLERGADVNLKAPLTPPLNFSAEVGDLEVCRLLLQNDADVNAKSSE